MSTEYDSISDSYVSLIGSDPVKQHVQYPLAARLLGGQVGTVLDIGCGDGYFTRWIARSGRSVLAYDISKAQLAKANDEEAAHPLGIRYFLTQSAEFSSPQICDVAIAVMVLMYASNLEDMTRFFEAAYRNTKTAAPFVGVIFNPDFKRLGHKVYNRRWSLMPGKSNWLKVDFYSGSAEEPEFSASYPHHSRIDYESAEKAAGYGSLTWKEATISDQGKAEMGKEFWKDFESDGPYVGFIAEKSVD